MRARHPDLPIVFVTGFAESEQLEGVLGADVPVLRKPFGIGEIAALLAQTCDEPSERRLAGAS